MVADGRVALAMRFLIEASSGLSVCGEASSGPAAILADEQLVPDVVVLDLMLPTARDGLEVLTRLVARGRGVVALSSRGDLEGAALAGGAFTFIDMDAGPDAILAAIRGGPRSTGAT